MGDTEVYSVSNRIFEINRKNKHIFNSAGK